MFKQYLVMVFCLWFSVAVPATAQTLDATTRAADGSYAFDHPASFLMNALEGSDDVSGVGRVGGSLIQLTVLGPTTTARLSPSRNLRAILLGFQTDSIAYDLDVDEAQPFDANGRAALVVPLQAQALDQTGYVYVVRFDNRQSGMMIFLGDEGVERETADAIAASLNTLFPDGSGVRPASNTGLAAVQLEHYAQEWPTAITELQEVGLIAPGGGSLVFQEERVFFDGLGAWFTPLAARSPRSNVVMAAELTFTPGSATELETCTLMARVEEGEQSRVTIFLQVGLDNEGAVFYVDQTSEERTATVDVVPLDLDFAETHHLLSIVQGDSLTVFLNGAVVIENAPVEDRSGFFGLSLLGRGDASRCEGRNVWVYDLAAFTAGICEANSPNGGINQRSGPGTQFNRVGLLGLEMVEVIGQQLGADGFRWYELEDGSFVREDVVNLRGDCSRIGQ